MKLPAKIDYACRAMLELSGHANDSIPLQLSDLAKAQRIPKEFLVQILSRLKDAGLVGSSRGMGGGYYLTRHPSSISLAEVLAAVDSHILERVKLSKSSLESEKLISGIWDRANQLLASELQMNFEDLLARLRGFYVDYQI
ncbi:MAG: Rrf2 family transcriptional regulator [Candidatus Omnitrophota bacterium]|jgi:Rrf2 family protein